MYVCMCSLLIPFVYVCVCILSVLWLFVCHNCGSVEKKMFEVEANPIHQRDKVGWKWGLKSTLELG